MPYIDAPLYMMYKSEEVEMLNQTEGYGYDFLYFIVNPNLDHVITL